MCVLFLAEHIYLCKHRNVIVTKTL